MSDDLDNTDDNNHEAMSQELIRTIRDNLNNSNSNAIQKMDDLVKELKYDFNLDHIPVSQEVLDAYYKRRDLSDTYIVPDTLNPTVPSKLLDKAFLHKSAPKQTRQKFPEVKYL